MEIEYDKSTLSFGSRFGQALAAVNLDGKDGDELVVGAPLHSTPEKYDVGKVKVFTFQGSSKRQSKEVRELSPPELTSGSRFGFAVESLGDIHNDDYDDFAVSAPYFGNERKGAVFIYRGNPKFIFGK